MGKKENLKTNLLFFLFSILPFPHLSLPKKLRIIEDIL